jgi:hypothetical protein
MLAEGAKITVGHGRSGFRLRAAGGYQARCGPPPDQFDGNGLSIVYGLIWESCLLGDHRSDNRGAHTIMLGWLRKNSRQKVKPH